MINNLDHIGAEAIRLMTGADRVAKAQAHIKQVWDAFTAAEEAGTTITINGVSLKKNWAKLINRTTRYCQMIAKDGDRKSQKKDANSVRPLALIKQLITVISETKDYAIVKGEAQEICDSLKWYPPAFKQENKEVKHYNRTGEKPGQKKPVKHAKRPKVGGSWCGKGLTNNNAASQNRYATCPFCIAAMAADIPVRHPETWSRHYTKDLKETRKLLVNAEKHATADSETYAGYTVPELKEKIAELEAKLTAIKEVKTPEQAVAAAKAAAAQKEEDRKTDAAMRVVRDSLRQCDDSVVWFQEYREALIAAKQPTWVSKIYNAALREIEQDIRHVEDAAKRKVEREAHQAADNERYEKGRARIAEINQQDFMKRYKAAKRLAKHYIELFKEYDTVKEIYHGNAYMHLLELHPNLATSNTRPYGIQKINLPITEKAFFADHEKALADFNRILQEGIDKGWMTTEPRTPAVPLESLDNCPTDGEVL